jgi:sulfur carrier protein ThiS
MEKLKRSPILSTSPLSNTAVEEAPEPLAEEQTETVGSNVQVIYGASVQHLPLVGVRMSDVRTLLHDILQVDRTSAILVNGRPVRATYRVAEGDCVEVVHQAGEKGAADGYANRAGRRPGRL